MGRTWKDKRIRRLIVVTTGVCSSAVTEERRADHLGVPFTKAQSKDSSIIHSPSGDRLVFRMLRGEWEGTLTRTGH